MASTSALVLRCPILVVVILSLECLLVVVEVIALLQVNKCDLMVCVLLWSKSMLLLRIISRLLPSISLCVVVGWMLMIIVACLCVG